MRSSVILPKFWSRAGVQALGLGRWLVWRQESLQHYVYVSQQSGQRHQHLASAAAHWSREPARRARESGEPPRKLSDVLGVQSEPESSKRRSPNADSAPCKAPWAATTSSHRETSGTGNRADASSASVTQEAAAKQTEADAGVPAALSESFTSVKSFDGTTVLRYQAPSKSPEQIRR